MPISSKSATDKLRCGSLSQYSIHGYFDKGVVMEQRSIQNVSYQYFPPMTTDLTNPVLKSPPILSSCTTYLIRMHRIVRIHLDRPVRIFSRVRINRTHSIFRLTRQKVEVEGFCWLYLGFSCHYHYDI